MRHHGLHITAGGEVREVTFAVTQWRSDDGAWHAEAGDFRNAEGEPFPLEPGDKIKGAIPAPLDVAVLGARGQWNWENPDGEREQGPIEYVDVKPFRPDITTVVFGEGYTASGRRKRRWWWRRG